MNSVAGYKKLTKTPTGQVTEAMPVLWEKIE